ncbi:MAG: pilus assembly protein PilM, partial [Bdellovibrionota bacterium]
GHRGNQAEVLALAVPQTQVEKMIMLLRDSTITPENIGTEATAIANLLEAWSLPPPVYPPLPSDLSVDGLTPLPPPRLLNIIVNIGYTHTVVSAFENDQLVGVRSLLWGGKNLAEQIARKYELPLTEAIKEMELKAFILLQKQDASFEAKIFSDTIAKSVKELVKDLQISLLALRSELGAEITQVGLIGGLCHIQGLGAFMTQHLEIPVNKINLLDRFPQIQFERDPKRDFQMMQALGLAIDGLKKPRNPAVSFLKGPFAKQNTQLKNFFHKWSFAMQMAAAAIVALFIWSFFREQVSVELASKSQDALRAQAKAVANLPAKQANESGVRRFVRDKKKVIAEVKSVSQVMDMNSAMDILKKVSDAAPGKTELKVDIVRFSVRDSRVTLEGYVNNPQELDQLKSRLAGLAINKRVSDMKANLGQVPSRLGFAFSFDVDRNVQKK